MNGIINVFKPKGISSHGVVSRLRKILNLKRIGHTGTLDPNVTGVLPICIGKATRVSEYLLDANKEYIGELSLGIKTDSQDSDGIILERKDLLNLELTNESIYKIFSTYEGSIKQIPPMHSAIRHNGKRLYELAREGIEVERKARNVEIYNLEILNIFNSKILFEIKCSKGTYVRTICNDIGEELGTFGYMSHLIRTGVGPFKIENAISLEQIEQMMNENDLSFLLPTDVAVKNLEKISLDSKFYNNIINGMKIETDIKKIDTELYRIYCKNDFIGIGKIISEKDKNYIKMDKVLI